MLKTTKNYVITCSVFLLLLLLAACGSSSNGGGTGSKDGSTTLLQQGQGSTATTPQQGGNTAPTVIVGTAAPSDSSPGVGPIVILSPTPVSGGKTPGQLVTLPDRTLVISNVTKVAGMDTSSTGVSISITVKDVGSKSIMNQASFYQLVATEGDSFGLQSSATSSLFGTITPQASRSGTIVFQVPTGALGGLRLLFRSEIDAETVFIPLNV